MDRLFNGVVGTLVTLVLVSFGLRLLAELFQRGLVPAGTLDNPVAGVLTVVFIVGLFARLARARSEKKGRAADRRAPRTIASDVTPWSSAPKGRQRHRQERGRDA